MANDFEKAKNFGNFTAEMVISLASGAYNLLGDAAFSLAPTVGEHSLRGFEKNMGLELSGENPKDIIMELSRIFIDELDFAEEIIVTETEEGHFQAVVNNCFGRPLTDEYIALTDTKSQNSFLCPIQNTIKAAFARVGYKMIIKRKPLEDHGSIITFEPI